MPELRARYEFKYLVTRDQVAWIRDAARMFCEPDPYGEDGLYSVNSLYLDTWDWRLARQTIEGQRNRYKLRIRTYGWSDDDPVFCENKGRVGTSILKQRALLDRRFVEPLLRGDAGPFPALKASHQADLDRFRNRFDFLDFRPRLWVRYLREAYGSTYGDGARLTFDTELEVQPPDPEHPYVPDPTQWTPVTLEGPPTIVEMKFNGAFPSWMQRVVHNLELRRVSCSKYVQGAVQLGEVPWNHLERGLGWMAF
jgi:hypothetical protein